MSRQRRTPRRSNCSVGFPRGPGGDGAGGWKGAELQHRDYTTGTRGAQDYTTGTTRQGHAARRATRRGLSGRNSALGSTEKIMEPEPEPEPKLEPEPEPEPELG